MNKTMSKSIIGGSFFMEKTGRKNNKYTTAFKMTVVKDYLSGRSGGLKSIVKKYDLKSDKQVREWVKKFNDDPVLLGIELRGRKSKGRPRTTRLDDMSLEEQNRHLRMENDILKKFNALLRNYEGR